MCLKDNDDIFPMDLVPRTESSRNVLYRPNKLSGAASPFWATLGLVFVWGLKPKFMGNSPKLPGISTL